MGRYAAPTPAPRPAGTDDPKNYASTLYYLLIFEKSLKQCGHLPQHITEAMRAISGEPHAHPR